jgi:hypothetical protein
MRRKFGGIMKKILLPIFTAAFLVAILSAGPAQAATYATKSWVSDYFMLKSSSYTRTQMDSRYVKKTDAYTKTQLDSRYVNVAGDTMTGNLTVDGELAVGGIGYTEVQHRVLNLPYSAFNTFEDMVVEVSSGYEQEGMFKTSGDSNFVWAPMTLPNGAIMKAPRGKPRGITG